MSPRRPTSSRDRLIQAAAALFYERGIHRTSVDTVVAEARLTKPTLYRHFPSKDDLVAAVVAYRSDNWRRVLEARVAEARSPLPRLLAVFDFLDEFITDESFRGCAVVNAAVEIPHPDDPGREIARLNKRENRQRFERLARDADLSRPRALAAALALLFEGAIVTAYVEGDLEAGGAARKAAERLIEAHRKK